MNYLQDKIYEAVNNGIQKALIVKDTNDDDASVNWHKKKTSAKVDIGKKYVDKLLKSYSGIELDEFMQFCEDHNYKYQFKSFEEYEQILNNAGCNISDTDAFLNCFDFDNLITVVLKDDTEMPISEYSEKYHNDECEVVEFLKLRVSYFELIINVNLYERNLKWSLIENPVHYINFTNNDERDGWDNTYNNPNIIKQYKKKHANKGMQNYYFTFTSTDNLHPVYNGTPDDMFNDYPIFQYVNDLADDLVLYNYKAYVPSAHEMSLIFKYVPILEYLDILDHSIDENNYYWTSSEVDAEKAETILYRESYLCIECIIIENEKDTRYKILPLFKKIQ